MIAAPIRTLAAVAMLIAAFLAWYVGDIDKAIFYMTIAIFVDKEGVK